MREPTTLRSSRAPRSNSPGRTSSTSPASPPHSADPQQPKTSAGVALSATPTRAISGWVLPGSGKRKRPGRRCGLSPARLPGLLEWTGPPLVECRALAFVSTCSHRPSRLAARRAMPRFGLDTGFPAPNPLAPLHADPVARAIGPGANRNRPRWVQLGWPQILRLLTTTPLPAPHPKVTCHPPPEGDRSPTARRRRACPVVSPHRSPAAGCPVPVERSSRSPFPDVTRRWPQARSDPTPAPVSRDVRRLAVAPVLPKESDSPVRGGREHCPCSDSALAS